MNNKKSIIFQISIFFLFIIIFINILILIQFKKSCFIELLIIDILLLSFYLFVLKKLKLLSILKDKELLQSRNLFLRNIMHEFKTPITKAKIVTNNYTDSKSKNTLLNVFNRLEYLLNEFAKIEELTSGQIKLEQKNYRVIDLLDQALDILLLDKTDVNVHTNTNLKINVDFYLFSIAFKNLIDNAMKYNINDKPEIIIDKEFIEIKNKGKKLSKEINQYYKPFNRDYEKNNDGLGLGLYISNNIINIHGYKLEYNYKDKNHIFKIIF